MKKQTEFEKDIDECEDAYYSGEKLMLFEAIRRCAQYKILIPDWVRREFEAGYFRYVYSEIKELGAAFGIERQKGFHAAAENKRLKLSFKVWKRVRELVDSGCSIDNELYDAVGKEFFICGSLARDYYRSVKKFLEEQK